MTLRTSDGWSDEREHQYAYWVVRLLRRRGVPITRQELLADEGFGRPIERSRRWNAMRELAADGKVVIQAGADGRTVVALPSTSASATAMP